jgi:6-phosphogluconolactonase (cycloisomerase 2 family)
MRGFVHPYYSASVGGMPCDKRIKLAFQNPSLNLERKATAGVVTTSAKMQKGGKMRLTIINFFTLIALLLGACERESDSVEEIDGSTEINDGAATDNEKDNDTDNDSESVIDDCDPNPCLNGGTCADGVNSYSCNCAEGYWGENCKEVEDICHGVACGERGSCVDGECVCKDGFTGETCETLPDTCYGINCGTHGFCVDGECVCNDGYWGESCTDKTAFRFLSKVIACTTAGCEITISPDGRHLYATAGHFSYSVSGQFFPSTGEFSIFQRNSATGDLSLIDAMRQGDEGVVNMVAPSRVVVSPAGEHLYLLTGGDLVERVIRVFSRDVSTGLLTHVGDEMTNLAHTALISTDGKFLYSIGSWPPTELRQYERDPSTGLVSYLGYAELPISSVDFLDSLTLSPEGTFLYAVASTYRTSKAVVISYTRDETSGELSLLGSLHGDTMSLPRIRSIAGSPDGKHYYAGSICSSCSIGILSPDENGNLVFDGALSGTSGATSMVFARSGTRLFAGGQSRFTAYRRDVETGSLSALQVYDGRVGVEEHVSIYNLVLSPDERHLYVSARFSSLDDTYVLVFEVHEPS